MISVNTHNKRVDHCFIKNSIFKHLYIISNPDKYSFSDAIPVQSAVIKEKETDTIKSPPNSSRDGKVNIKIAFLFPKNLSKRNASLLVRGCHT